MFFEQPLSVAAPVATRRSRSKRLSGRQQNPPNTATCRCNLCLGAVMLDGSVQVFSRTSDAWITADIIHFVEDKIWVEYNVAKGRCGKILHQHSAHLKMPVVITSSLDTGSRLANSATVSTQPVMQGCRFSLPEDLRPEDYYADLDYIWTLLKSGAAVLLKGSWLRNCFKRGSVLPRRQELPPDAVWNVQELEEKVWENNFSVGDNPSIDFVSISHCWYTKEHPDPHGEQLQEVGPFLEAKFRRWSESNMWGYDLAIFWCWCSFFQEPRQPAEQELFMHSMEHMDLWYTNSNFEVWMLTKVPLSEYVVNNVPYDMRGWTTWEKSVACLINEMPDHAPRAPLDLGACCPRMAKTLSFDEIISACKSPAQTAPLLPDEFATLIRSKHFTKGQPDLDLVISNYQRNFKQVMHVVNRFTFANLRTFGSNEVKQLCRVLPFTHELMILTITNCPIGGDGADALASTLLQLSTASKEMLKLKQVNVWDCDINSIGPASKERLAKACAQIEANFLYHPPVKSIVKCSNCGNASMTTKFLCGACKQAFYCSKQCQRQDWASHKQHCGRLAARGPWFPVINPGEIVGDRWLHI